nr:hypothetical protein [Aneurinibacillus sp. XH2]
MSQLTGFNPYDDKAPWDLIYDDQGRLVGEVYIIYGTKRKKKKIKKGA